MRTRGVQLRSQMSLLDGGEPDPFMEEAGSDGTFEIEVDMPPVQCSTIYCETCWCMHKLVHAHAGACTSWTVQRNIARCYMLDLLTIVHSLTFVFSLQVEMSMRRHADSKVVVLESAGACIRATNTSHVSSVSVVPCHYCDLSSCLVVIARRFYCSWSTSSSP